MEYGEERMWCVVEWMDGWLELVVGAVRRLTGRKDKIDR